MKPTASLSPSTNHGIKMLKTGISTLNISTFKKKKKKERSVSSHFTGATEGSARWHRFRTKPRILEHRSTSGPWCLHPKIRSLGIESCWDIYWDFQEPGLVLEVRWGKKKGFLGVYPIQACLETLLSKYQLHSVIEYCIRSNFRSQ